MLLLNDYITTVEKAFDEICPNWRDYEGLIICGTHSPKDVENQINIIQSARESGTPALGICFGYQLMAIEYARNVLGIKDATSEEFGKGTFIVKKLPYLNVGLKEGETYWNNYSVDPEFIKKWEMPKNFIGVQSHPEYQSSKDRPHPTLVKFIDILKEYAKRN